MSHLSLFLNRVPHGFTQDPGTDRAHLVGSAREDHARPGEAGEEVAAARREAREARLRQESERRQRLVVQVTKLFELSLGAGMVSDLPCDVRREGGQSLVMGGSSLVLIEGKVCNPLQSFSSQDALGSRMLRLEERLRGVQDRVKQPRMLNTGGR